jgi:hypothetical protein
LKKKVPEDNLSLLVEGKLFNDGLLLDLQIKTNKMVIFTCSKAVVKNSFTDSTKLLAKL